MNDEIQKYMQAPAVIDKFRGIVGGNANAFISSVMLAVMNSNQLQQCSPQSILSAATQAATLRLSVDPSIGEAAIIPRFVKDKGWTASFQVMYRGIYRMALRTNRYRYIQDTKIFAGETVIEDRMTGLHSIEGAPSDKDSWHAWLLSFELLSGFRKTFVMTRAELEEHGAKYGGKNPLWKSEFDKMARKTVYRLGLSRYGVFDAYDQNFIMTADNDEETEFSGDVVDVEAVVFEAPRPAGQILDDLGFDDAPAASKPQSAPEAKPKPATAAMTVEQAEAFETSTGAKYGTLESDVLLNMITAMLNKHDTSLDGKIAACRMIIDARQNGRPIQA